jgi:hypothetical protein
VNRRILKLNRPSLLCLLLVFGVSAPLSSVQAAVVEITVVNHSFEVGPPTPPNINDQDDVLPEGWTLYNQEDLDPYYIENYNPTETLGTYYDSSVTGAPDGSKVGYAFLPSVSVGPYPDGSFKPFGFEQELNDEVKAGTYELSVAVGNPQTFEDNIGGFGGYGLELFARDYDDTDPTSFVDTVFGIDENSTAIGEGLFDETILLSVFLDSSDASDALLFGQALGIRLYNLNLDVPDINGVAQASQVDFDNVVLTHSAVPVPAAIWLFGTALLGMTGFNMRRKRAAVNEPC